MKRPHSKVTLKVSRHSLLESSFKATRNFSVSDWSKNFEVVFQDEEALDWGGPRREWFELICKALFDTTSQLFTRFSDNNQALVSLQFSVLNSPNSALACCWLNNVAAKFSKKCAASFKESS